MCETERRFTVAFPCMSYTNKNLNNSCRSLFIRVYRQNEIYLVVLRLTRSASLKFACHRVIATFAVYTTYLHRGLYLRSFDYVGSQPCRIL